MAVIVFVAFFTLVAVVAMGLGWMLGRGIRPQPKHSFWGGDQDWQPGDLRVQPWRPVVVEVGRPPQHGWHSPTDEFKALVGREFPATQRLPVEVR